MCLSTLLTVANETLLMIFSKNPLAAANTAECAGEDCTPHLTITSHRLKGAPGAVPGDFLWSLRVHRMAEAYRPHWGSKGESVTPVEAG